MKSPGELETFPERHLLVLGHQGGWDEILMVVGPLAVIGLLLWLANKRVTAQLEAEAAGETGGGEPSGNSTS
jgi:hypothetical protein